MNKLYKKVLPYIVIAFITVFSTFILWLPFILRLPQINHIKVNNLGFQNVISHWDGPLYIIPAKTLYDVNNPIMKMSPMGYDPKYFAAHLPLYPLTIKFFSIFAGYPKGMLLSTVFFAIALLWFFYFFVKKIKLSPSPLILTLVFSFLTPRFFVVRSVGSPEPLFLLLILMSVYFFIIKRYFLAGLFGGLSAATKTPGILLFVTYLAYFIEEFIKTKKLSVKWFWIFLIPLGLLLVFLLYFKQYGDFFAYFHSGDNLHLVFPPFSVFNFQKSWVGTAWLEEIIFMYFFYLLAILSTYIKKNLRSIFYFLFFFFFALIFVEHRDVSRYSLPMLPFALITFEKFFTSKKFLIVLIFFIPAIYFFAWNFLLYNTAPIADWSPFL